MTTAATVPPAQRRRRTDDGPARRCLATRTSAPITGLIRFVAAPDGEIVPDLAERLPGRGMWLAATAAAFDIAIAKNPFAKAAKRAVRVPKDLRARVESLLLQRCIAELGLARRAGTLTVGAERIGEVAAQRRIGLLLVATDASSQRAVPRGAPTLAALSSAELGAAFDREAIAAVAVAPGPLAERIARDAARLAGLRMSAGRTETRPVR